MINVQKRDTIINIEYRVLHEGEHTVVMHVSSTWELAEAWMKEFYATSTHSPDDAKWYWGCVEEAIDCPNIVDSAMHVRMYDKKGNYCPQGVFLDDFQ